MSSLVIFVVGAPASGKTTMVKRFLDPFDTYLTPAPKWTVSGRVCAAGHYGQGTFDGADTIPFNGAIPALEFWHSHNSFASSITFLDGDRMSNTSCLSYIKERNYRSVCVYLNLSEKIRNLRASKRSKQNASWVKGRITKARRFFENFGDDKVEICSEKSVKEIYNECDSFINSCMGENP